MRKWNAFDILKKGAAAALAAAMVGACAFPVLANDHTDRHYSFVFSQGNDKSGFARKQDSTPVYVKCKSASHPWYARVIAGYAESDVGDILAREYMVTGTTKFISVPYYAGRVYGIWGEPTYWDSAAWGYWSPDSV